MRRRLVLTPATMVARASSLASSSQDSESREAHFGSEAWTGSGEFDEEIIQSGFTSTAVAHGESRKVPIVVEQERVAEALLGDRTDLGTEARADVLRLTEHRGWMGS